MPVKILKCVKCNGEKFIILNDGCKCIKCFSDHIILPSDARITEIKINTDKIKLVDKRN